MRKNTECESGKGKVKNKKKFLFICFLTMFYTAACADMFSDGFQRTETVIQPQTLTESDSGSQNYQSIAREDNARFSVICLDLYRQAVKENKRSELDTVRGIVKRFGAHGYPAVDSKNQIDMTEAERVLGFCEKVKRGEEGETTVIEVNGLDGFAKYDLRTRDGTVDVVRSYYEYDDEKFRKTMISYQADNWNGTEEGYLMFSGAYFSEVSYLLTLSEEEIHTAWRVFPLDEACRELNRKYLLPIGYGRNNMFLVDWSEEDFGELNFYDMYDILWPKTGEKVMPCVAAENLGFGVVYRIPEEWFESVIMAYFHIDARTLRSKTVYHPEDSTYEYRSRGYYEAEYPEYPYSEVTAYTENDDGTLTLLVQAVFPYAGDARGYVHEVVVRPLENGGTQYVSNRVIRYGDGRDDDMPVWHVPRLEKGKWEEIYGGGS